MDQDYSGDFFRIRGKVTSDAGVTYQQFVSSLAANYGVVYRDIFIGHAFLWGSLLAIHLLQPTNLLFCLAKVVFGTFSIGFWVFYLHLFFHEAAHYHLAKSRARNDLIANWLIGIFTGQSVSNYRKVHFEHHRLLGTTKDSERSYFNYPSFVYFLKTISGFSVLQVLSTSRKTLCDQKKEVAFKKHKTAQRIPLMFPVGIAFHLAVLGFLFCGRDYFSCLAWSVGVACVFPSLTAFRQIIEHRDSNAKQNVDYANEDHGALTRIFDDSLFAKFFGGAGFNRHLLHHWDPQISYSNLRELETFLMTTQIAPVIAMRRSTYWRSFIEIWKGNAK